MIRQIKYIKSKEHNPYLNLALEEYLLHNVKEEECILYLWQNEKTVVIGRNQNPWKECKINELKENGGYLVRRLSGGGAVFHDLGNLNFTFLVKKPDYDVDKQLEVIIRALHNMGIPGKKSGRNDITVEEKKFSGNAFYRDGKNCYHHGTILINVDMNHLSKYLNVSRDKLESKGVKSVKSRVTNLIEYKPDLTIEKMEEELIKAFSLEYQLTAKESTLNETIYKELYQRKERFESWDWIYGNNISFAYHMGKRFSWGDFEIHINTQKGRVSQCKIYSDAMDIGLVDLISKGISKSAFSSKDMIEAIRKIPVEDSRRENMIDDICSLIMSEDL